MSDPGGRLRLMSSERPAEVTTGPVDQDWLGGISPWLQGEDPPALTILPERIVEGKAVFSADIAPLAKQLRSQGFDVQLLSTPAQTFQSKYGADWAIELSILLNVAGSAAWDGIKFLYHLIKLDAQGAREIGEEPKLTLNQGIYRHPDGSSFLWQTFYGAPDKVIDRAESAIRDYLSATQLSEDQAVEHSEDTDDEDTDN
jgi:hypothetical protein